MTMSQNRRQHQPDDPEPDEVAEDDTEPVPETDKALAEEEQVTQDQEPASPPESIPDSILKTARAVMGDIHRDTAG